VNHKTFVIMFMLQKANLFLLICNKPPSK